MHHSRELQGVVVTSSPITSSSSIDSDPRHKLSPIIATSPGQLLNSLGGGDQPISIPNITFRLPSENSPTDMMQDAVSNKILHFIASCPGVDSAARFKQARDARYIMAASWLFTLAGVEHERDSRIPCPCEMSVIRSTSTKRVVVCP